VVQAYGIFGGDVINNNGTGGESIYGMVFKDENFTISHDQPYLLSMVKPGSTPNTNNSNFMITLSPLVWLDNR
jgi:cyclophilin family peptidyl-prolyl cis-trans isomerase